MCSLDKTVLIFTICHILWLFQECTDAFVLVKAPNNDTLQRFFDQPAASSFSKSFPDDGIVGYVAYTVPPDACTAVQLSPNGSDWIAVISMSTECRFYDQVLNAEKAGFIAAIVHNNISNDLITMRDARHRLNIPSTFIGLSAGRLMEQYDRRRDVYVQIIDVNVPDEELLLIILAGISSFSAVTVLGIVIGIGIHNCYRNHAQLLSRWKLKRLPLHVFKKGDLYESCAICLEEYIEGEKLRILPCAHAFHSKCIDEWLTKNKKTCPLCNETVNPSRRPVVSSPGHHGEDSERTPLLLPTEDDEPALLTNRSDVEVHQELPQPSVHQVYGQRNYGTAGTSLVVGGSEPSSSQASATDADSSSAADFQSERPVLEKGKRKRTKAKLEARPRQPQVVISGRNSDRGSDNIV